MKKSLEDNQEQYCFLSLTGFRPLGWVCVLVAAVDIRQEMLGYTVLCC